MNWLYFILIGLLAGFLAGQLLKGRGFGLVGNLIVGVLGSLVGGAIASAVGLGATNILGSLLIATGGAVVLLLLVGLIKKA
jgi:uncharacterized membrane protein YeaQ/YmgE (transglycosylase-associated protein family)